MQIFLHGDRMIRIKIEKVMQIFRFCVISDLVKILPVEANELKRKLIRTIPVSMFR